MAEGVWNSGEFFERAFQSLREAGVSAFGSTGIGWEIIVHKSDRERARDILKKLPGSDRIYIPD